MRAFIILIMVICTFAIHADTQGTAEQSAESPWQGTWTGSEVDTFGTRVAVTATINVSNTKISGSWRARGAGRQNITGQVNGNEASITILQGGSLIRATLADENSFEYRGLRGHGKLTRRVDP